jgi:hypothetical protein
MVAIGYHIERILWEIVFVFIFLFALVEMCLSRSIWLDKRGTEGKIIQKALFPCSLVTGLLGAIVGVDIRGAYGIYTVFPDFPRFCLEILTVIPTVSFSFIWMLQLYASICRASGSPGFLRTGTDERRQSIMI